MRALGDRSASAGPDTFGRMCADWAVGGIWGAGEVNCSPRGVMRVGTMPDTRMASLAPNLTIDSRSRAMPSITILHRLKEYRRP